jgi:hypothetical protein
MNKQHGVLSASVNQKSFFSRSINQLIGREKRTADEKQRQYKQGERVVAAAVALQNGRNFALHSRRS